MTFNRLDDKDILRSANAYFKKNMQTYEGFIEDLNSIKLIKIGVKKIALNRCFSIRSVINRIIVFINLFGVTEAKHLLAKEVPIEYHGALKTILYSLGMVEKVDQFSLIKVDNELLKILKDAK